MERAYSLTAIPCGTCVREHSGGHQPKSRPSRHPGRAPPGHGGDHGRRPSGPHAGTPVPTRTAAGRRREWAPRPVGPARWRRKTENL